MTWILYGLGVVLFTILVSIVYHWVKAMRDPDVQIATDLRMSVLRYRKYEKLYNDHWDIMMKFGSNSRESEQYFARVVFPELQKLSMNEWRRYQSYREKLLQKQMLDEIMGG